MEEAGPKGLASALLASGALTSDWLPAFEAVPRHFFVPDVIWPGRAGMNRQSDRVVRSDEPEAWWAAVYRDAPITTQWDDGTYTGPGKGKVPSCSNSMPTMVFSMLDALSVEEGHRVLEIGTGTGWNAALLSHRVGAANVVTVEVDATSARAARTRLDAAGYEPLTVVGDGAEGFPGRAPYDRVIATCSVGSLPRAWIGQTKPGGVIVAPWGPVYGGEAVVRLTVAGDGTASGRFVGSSAFMRLRAQRTARTHVREYLGGRKWPADGVRSVTDLSPEAVADWHVMFAIGVQVPGAFPWAEVYGDGSYTLWLRDTAVTSWATVDYEPGRDEYEVWQSGPRKLWAEVRAAYHWWDAQGRPGFDRFGLTVDADGERVWLDEPGRPVPLVRP
ncbi:methyltransferase domain-containing protein [Streptomyces mobaraensis NBRC 13819 = DSM 40847]|uniref:Protein-L-isoaspartate O-methyltransferase n=1 Tax=Streptomyces mobaraensis (strain ATCC 29032 / DSM 40847 / JCM 4168 / NBRC 13819 / NCIMB 11159 / IPCR 16-22) TaxID=1223523 RepID=M3B3L7_STRM1|nr:methyltransferase domain-containing protein [Streptomyces mobaraensis]EMF00558.1 putative methyltransferase [Streptomyces mobaraensis NBRC 13819 = DSM 40847]QTT77737.1 methyltransferase domain-containing protein [Streptomyces mobaraensis NBRC 13819 = DSM 40847]